MGMYSIEITTCKGSTIYNNGKVALCKDLIFGLCINSEDGWIPLRELGREYFPELRELLTVGNPVFFPWWEEFHAVERELGLS